MTSEYRRSVRGADVPVDRRPGLETQPAGVDHAPSLTIGLHCSV